MRNAVLADTGPLYAALDPTDSNHGRAQEEIGRLNREGFVVAVSYPTLCESYSLVLYKLGIGTAHEWLAEVRESASLVSPTPNDYGEAASRLRAYEDQALSMFDAVTAVLSERLEGPVGSYDQHFDVMLVGVRRGA